MKIIMTVSTRYEEKLVHTLVLVLGFVSIK